MQQAGYFIISFSFTNCLLHPCFFPRYLYFVSYFGAIGASYDYDTGERHELGSGIYAMPG